MLRSKSVLSAAIPVFILLSILSSPSAYSASHRGYHGAPAPVVNFDDVNSTFIDSDSLAVNNDTDDSTNDTMPMPHEYPPYKIYHFHQDKSEEPKFPVMVMRTILQILQMNRICEGCTFVIGLVIPEDQKPLSHFSDPHSEEHHQHSEEHYQQKEN